MTFNDVKIGQKFKVKWSLHTYTYLRTFPAEKWNCVLLDVDTWWDNKKDLPAIASYPFHDMEVEIIE